MKGFTIALVTLLLGASTLQAAPRAARLSYEFGPMYQLHHLPVGVNTLSSIEVRKNGNVVYNRRNLSGKPSKNVVIAKLNAYQMDRIENLIDRASLGNILSPEILCAAVPSETRNYLADRGQLILSVGAEPCGTEQYNDSRAAVQLIEILNNLRVQAESKAMPLAN